MELIRGLHNLRPRHRSCVATIGAFDGVHRGHQAVLRQLIAKAEERNCASAVVVFEPLPREYFRPHSAPPRLMSFREKFLALEQLGIDRLLRVRFDEKLRKVGPREFVEQVFVHGLKVHHLVVGDDFHFGRNRSGDYQLLQELGAEHGFEVEDTSTLELHGERVSSTRVRQALVDADFALAEELLGRPFSISGRVIEGNQLGRQLGVPTANLQLRRLRAPLAGVYAVEVAGVDGKLWPGVANVGTRPTIGDLTEAILEVHLLDFDRDIYRRTIDVIFRKKLRDEYRFDSLDALKEQIFKDIDEGRRVFGINSN